MNEIWLVIKDNNIKNNSTYSAYNFSNKRQEDEFNKSGKLPQSIPSIHNDKAVTFIVKNFKGRVKAK